MGPFSVGNLVEKIIREFLEVFSKGIVSGLAWILAAANRASIPDLSAPWVLEARNRVWVVAGMVALLLLLVSCSGGALRRGPAGILPPILRMVGGYAWAGIVFMVLALLLQISDAFTGYLAPDLKGDMTAIMTTITQRVAPSPMFSILIGSFLAFVAFLGVMVMAIQLFVLKYLILTLYILAPLAGVAAIADRGMDLLRRYNVGLLALLMVKPFMALFLSLIAAPLHDTGQAAGDETLVAFAGLIAAPFVPWLFLTALIGILGTSFASINRASEATAPTETAGKVGHAVTHPWSTVQTMRSRVDDHHQQQAHTKKVTRSTTKVPTLAGAAVAGGPVGAGAALAGQAATNGAGKVGHVVAAPAHVTKDLLVAGNGEPQVVKVKVPAPPADITAGQQHDWQREHRNGERPPTQPPPPPVSPEGARRVRDH